MQDENRKDALKYLLDQIPRAERRRRELVERLLIINERRKSPLAAVNYTAVNRSRNAAEHPGAAAIVFQLAEIEEMINDQQAEIEKATLRVMRLLDLLPLESLEREILELRYIDRLSIDQITETVFLSRSQVHRRMNAGLDQLLEFPEVLAMLEEAEEAYLAFRINGSLAHFRKAAAQK